MNGAQQKLQNVNLALSMTFMPTGTTKKWKDKKDSHKMPHNRQTGCYVKQVNNENGILFEI